MRSRRRSVRSQDDLARLPRLQEGERLLVPLERQLGGDERTEVDDAVLEEPARRVPRLPDLAAVDRGDGEVLDDERLRDVDRRGAGGGRIPKSTMLPPWRTMSNASSIALSAPDISKTTPTPWPSFCSANHAGT